MKTELQRVKPPYSYKEIGFRVRSLREANGYTRDALAVKINISTKFLYEIEMGKKGFSAEILYKLSQTLAVSADYILTGTDGMASNTSYRTTSSSVSRTADSTCQCASRPETTEAHTYTHTTKSFM